MVLYTRYLYFGRTLYVGGMDISYNYKLEQSSAFLKQGWNNTKDFLPEMNQHVLISNGRSVKLTVLQYSCSIPDTKKWFCLNPSNANGDLNFEQFFTTEYKFWRYIN